MRCSSSWPGESTAPRTPRCGTRAAAAAVGEPQDSNLPEPLTPRQVAVLAQLAQGKSNKQIARDLAISDMTVKAHVTAILRSLGVATRAQAIVAFRRERMQEPERTP